MRISRLDWFLIILAVSASLIGVATLMGGGENGEPLAVRKIVWLSLGVIVMLAFAFVNYQSLGSYAAVIYIAAILVLLFTLVPFIGTKINGARSWIRFFGFGFQPAEFMKLALVIALAKYLVLRESEIGKLKELVIPFLIAAVPMLLIAAQPDLGSAVLILPVLFTMLFLGGANTNVIFGFAIVGLFSLTVPMFLEYQRFIIVDEIESILRDSDFRLANAIRVLKFEIWQFIDNPALVSSVSQNLPEFWAVKAVAAPENRELILETARQINSENPNFFRDLMNNDLFILFSILGWALLYGISLLVTFMTGSRLMKRISTVSIIVALSLTGAFTVHKLMNFKPHQVVRIVSFANPEKFPKGAGYQLRQSLITIGSGQVGGKGIYKGDMTRGETPFLPEWHNDFIFSPVGEQFGLWGTIGTLVILFSIVFRGLSIALQSKDDFGALLAGGITSIFFFHIMINIGITVGLFPVTGIPLSFISYGGSNMMMNFIALGILLNINMRRFINA